MSLLKENTNSQAATRIQKKNTTKIMNAALEVFSRNGFGGTTIDQIAKEAGLSKPNILYYFTSKEEIHLSLLQGLLDKWLEPLKKLEPLGNPISEITDYVQRKLEMSQEFPRESRLFAIEILQGAEHLKEFIKSDLQPLLEEKCGLIDHWVEQGLISKVDSLHLIFSIWATTQHYADFDSQIKLISGEKYETRQSDASIYLKNLFSRLLTD